MDHHGWWEQSRITLENQLSEFDNMLVMSFRGVQSRTLSRIIRTIQPDSRCYHCPEKGAIKALRNHADTTRDTSRLQLIPYLKGQVFLILTNSVCQDILDEIEEVEVDGSPNAHIKPRPIAMYEDGRVVSSRNYVRPMYMVPVWI